MEGGKGGIERDVMRGRAEEEGGQQRAEQASELHSPRQRPSMIYG